MPYTTFDNNSPQDIYLVSIVLKVLLILPRKITPPSNLSIEK